MALVEVKKSIIPELQKYGAFDVSACYDCGLCTASCNLTKVGGEFPRKLIHSASLGLDDQLIGSEHIWRCYYCGQCTETCPRQADPASFMMAARRYAITRYDVTRISKIFNLNPIVYLLLTIVVTAIIGGVLWSLTEDIPAGNDVRFFDFIKYDDVHDFGLIFLGVYVLLIAAGVATMLLKSRGSSIYKTKDIKGSFIVRWFKGFWSIAVNEVMFQRTLKAECEDEPGPLWRSRWASHMTTFWGFSGLLIATAYAFILKEDANEHVSLLYPSRLIGTIAGIALMYGVTLSIIDRLRRKTTYTQNSTMGDWILLILLFTTGLTGFLLEIGLYMDAADWMYYAFYIHLVVAAVLLFLIPFTKFSHIIYRPVALWIHKSKFEYIHEPEVLEPIEATVKI
ncbi:MAG: 4Fe-4S dicluster domain-containing protein [Candidatus Kariarchaeaceae archaeon]|jgi:nitrate reductase gamma subunit/ferredoxin